MQLIRLAAGLAVLTTVASCGGDPDPVAAGTGGSAGQGGSGAGGCGGGGGGADGSVCVERVRGRLLDEQGEPVGGVVTTVCGSISCSPGLSDADGRFVVEVGSYLTPAEFSIIAHVRELDMASFYFQLPPEASGPDIDVGDLLQLRMPVDGVPLVAKQDDPSAPAQTLTSAEVTLEVPQGVQIQLEFDDVALGDEGRTYKVLRVPAERQTAFVPDELGVAAVWAFYPFEASFRPLADPFALTTARLSFPNDSGLPASSAVELLALGSFVFPTWVTPATFEVVATGQVTADGLRIEMSPGEGVSYLTWIGIRPAP